MKPGSGFEFFSAFCFVVLQLALLGGCASIVQGRHQKIILDTLPSGAACTVGPWSGKTPAVIHLERGFSYAVTCRLEGHREGRAVLRKKGTAWSFGNLLLGGIVGLAIDSGSGSGYRVNSMARLPLSPAETADSPSILPGNLPDNLLPVLTELIANTQSHRGVHLQKRLNALSQEQKGTLYDFIIWNEAQQHLTPDQYLLYEWLMENRSDFQPFRL